MKTFDFRDAKIFVAGHNGMVGSAILRNLKSKGYSNIVTRSRRELDLINQYDVNEFLKREKPYYIFIAAAKVGGIYANDTYRADFLYENLMIEANLIHAAHVADIQNICFLGSSCIYPRDCLQPIKEDYILSGPLEKTNEPYAISKIAGIKLCESYNDQYGRNYISIMPTNMYGPNDNYDLNTSHVLPALIRKTHSAKLNNSNTVSVWGSGRPRREFMYVDDFADACTFLMEIGYTGSLLNVGTGEEVTIKELAEIIKKIVGYNGNIVFDSSKPDGTLRKLLDTAKLRNLGWKPKIDLRSGIGMAYRDFVQSLK